MDVEVEKNILVLLSNRFNKWWGNQIIPTPEFKRMDFNYLLGKISASKAIILIGPRQIGKTTLVMQLIKELIEKKQVPQKRILYVQFDDVELRLLSTNNILIDVLTVYKKHVLQEDLDTTNNDVYLFFDEVQRVEDWAEQVKALLATNFKLHILATGSASFNISQKSKETLPGRQELYSMHPLKFADALCLYYLNDKRLDSQNLKFKGHHLREKFEIALKEKSFKNFFKECNNVYIQFATKETEITAALTRYLSKGGYPEIISTGDPSTCQRLLKSYANDAIVKDLMPWFKIRDFPTAEKLLFLLAATSGEELNIQEILKRLHGSNSQTVTSYVSFFESLNLLKLLPVHTGSKLGSAKHPKIYFLDVGLRNAIAGVLDAPISDTEKGHLAETVAHDHLLRLSYKLNAASTGHVSCLRDKKGEIDFILELPRYNTKIPIEVKFRENLENLKVFYEHTGKKQGIIITENKLDLNDETLYLPLWMFLIIC